MIYNIACTIDSSYAPHFATMCCSLFENNKDIPFKVYLIYDELQKDHVRKINKLFKKYNQVIQFIKIDKRQFQGFPLSAHATLANYFRVILPDLLPCDVERVLYLDCDLVVNGSIIELWDLDIEEKALLAWGYHNPQKSKILSLKGNYFNSGVMLINLAYWRQSNAKSRVLKYIEKNRDLLEFWDQDAFNAVLKDEWTPLNEKYNFTKDIVLSKVKNKPIIFHFVGMHKPWNPHCQHRLKEKYFDYYNLTPFAPDLLESIRLKLKIVGAKVLNRVRNFWIKTNKPSIAIKKRYGEHRIVSAQEGNDWIGRKLKENEIFFVGRIGSTELSCLCYYHKIYEFSSDEYQKMKKNMMIASGFFPPTDHYLNKFAETYIEALSTVDLIGVWFNNGEEELIDRFSSSKLCELKGLEPYYHHTPWSRCLQGKRILVIHPFVESIEKQFLRKEKLFPKDKCLPDFELKTIKAVQTIAGNRGRYETWFHALDDMKYQISNEDFDIAIIGAGAYGFHLGSYVKSLGKSAIHLGGATQILFGVRGKRWEENNVISSFFNEYWTYPSNNEKPEGADLVENGCYW